MRHTYAHDMQLLDIFLTKLLALQGFEEVFKAFYDDMREKELKTLLIQHLRYISALYWL